MEYTLFITRTAERDLSSAAEYIKYSLLDPESAAALLQETDSKMKSLLDSPQKNELVDDPLLKEWGVRFITVRKYLLFYKVIEETHTVCILRFLDYRRGWVSLLRRSF